VVPTTTVIDTIPRVIPGMEAVPLRKIDMPITFGTTSNFCKETFTFEVVGFPGTYHAILGRPAYAKFMAVPNYTYLKLKMSRPKGVITIYTKFQHAYECNTECFQFIETLIRSEKIAAKPTTVDLDDPTLEQLRHFYPCRSTCTFYAYD
jgi:hypothetical protein